MRLVHTLLSIGFLALTIPCFGQAPGRISVDGFRYPLTQTGIQQAFTDACVIGNGTEVFLPISTSITVTNTTGQQFLVTCMLRIHGPSTQSTWFVVGGSVPNTVPLFRIQPSGANRGFVELDHFRVTSSGGTTGGTVILLDATNGTVNDIRVHDIDSCCVDPTVWFMDMVPIAGDQYFHGHIYDNNIIGGGINMQAKGTGDSWLIEHNSFGSVLNGTRPCINATTGAGAAHITAFNNWGSCTGGFFISHGTTQCKIIYNQIEQDNFGLNEANNAMIDLIGDSYAIDQCEITGNNINAQTNAPINVRLDHATNTIIRGNRIFVKSATGVGIALTTIPTGTYIDDSNEFGNTGGGAVAMTNAGSTNPFTRSFLTATGTQPATVGNDSAGGINFTENGKTWDLNSGTLNSPKGLGLAFNGATSGGVIEQAPAIVAAGPPTSTLLPISGGNVAKFQLDQDFTTANNTNLQTIAGSAQNLSWTVPANAMKWSFHCVLAYSQATANVAVAFGIQAATNAPTNIFAIGTQQITVGPPSTKVDGVLPTLNTTTATNIVSGTPGATATNYTAMLDGTIELPASANTINIMVSTANGSDAVTVKRGSYCQAF